MRFPVGDVQFSVPADEWTNLAYLLGVLVPMGIAERLVVGAALSTVCAGSFAWHRLETRKARRADELGMMMTLSAAAAFLGGRIASGVPPWIVIVVTLPIWGFYLLFLHRTSSFAHSGVWAAVLLGETAYLAGWRAAVPLGLFLVALWGQFSWPWNEARYEHGLRHGLIWHQGTALSIASALYLGATA